MKQKSNFRFKQFDLIQSEAHLKITTEATLFAAWANVAGAKRILDIGAGTGLLSLMLAQKSDAEIEAIELQSEAAEICRNNFENSPWQKQLKCWNTAVQDFESAEKYDCIICNPPFFFKHLKGEKQAKNKAMHNETLSLEDLLNSVIRLLANEGQFYLLLPSKEMNDFIELAQAKNLFLQEKLELIHKAGKPVLREAACFAKLRAKEMKTSQLIMRNADESYSAAYRELLKEYLIIF